jgi:hypothetical protein
MPSVFENNECVYMWLPALTSAMSIEAVAKMAVFTFLEAARAWNNSGKPTKKSYVFIDEAQIIVGPIMERFCQQASGSKVRLVFSNQTLATLDNRDAPNLSSTIWTNTRIKQAFGLLDPKERDDWIKLSGEEVGYIHSYTHSSGSHGSTNSTTSQQVIHTRLNHNIINAVNNSVGSSLFYTTRDAGFCSFNTIPRQVWCPHPLTLEDYQRHSTTPWPDAPQTNVQSGQAQTTVVNSQTPLEIEQKAQDKYAALEQLFQKASQSSGRRRSVVLNDQ